MGNLIEFFLGDHGCILHYEALHGDSIDDGSILYIYEHNFYDLQSLIPGNLQA